MILNPATSPNSFNMALLVKANTAKPIAAEILQNNVTTPILAIICTMAALLLPVSLYAV